MLSAMIYPRSAVDLAQKAFGGLCDIEVDARGSDLRLTISPTETAPPETVDEFLSYALSAAIEFHLASSTQ